MSQPSSTLQEAAGALVDVGLYNQAAALTQFDKQMQVLVLNAHAARNVLQRAGADTTTLDAALLAFGVPAPTTPPTGLRILKGNADLVPLQGEAR